MAGARTIWLVCRQALASAVALFRAAVIMLCGMSGVALSQGVAQRPPLATEAVSSLGQSSWEQLAEGIDTIAAATALGTRITALRIDLELYRFEVLRQSGANGERASTMADREGATAAVNGGFFANANGVLFPVGMLMDDGVKLSQPWSATGGYLVLPGSAGGETPRIMPSREGLPEWAHEAIQSRPLIIEPGRRWAMRTNDGNQERRTLVCMLDDGKALIMLVTGGGLSLFEAGWILREPRWGGFFDCDAALALDGGSSTQLHVADRPDLAIEGLTRVDNALGVFPRDGSGAGQ